MTYSVEFEPLVGLLVVVPDRPVVLIHHDAWATPVQMHVNYYYSNKHCNVAIPMSFLFSGEISSRNCSVEAIAWTISFCYLGGILIFENSNL